MNSASVLAGSEVATGSGTLAYSARNLLAAGDGLAYTYDGRGVRVALAVVAAFGTVTGTVVDASGQPLAGATVRLAGTANATATDVAGNVSAPSSPLAFTVDTTIPAAPTFADASDVNSYVNAVHDTSAQALAGTAGANDTINIYLNGATTPAYTTQANASGNWSQTIGVLANGSYSYTATAIDAAGNISAPIAPGSS